MAKSKKQAKVIVPVDGGVQKTLPSWLIKDSQWSDGNNIRFGQGYIEKVGGWQRFMATQLDGPVKYVDNYYKYNGNSYLLFFTDKSFYQYDVTNKTAVKIGAYNNPVGVPVSATCAQDWYVFTAASDNIMYWDGTTYAPLPGTNDCIGGVTSLRAKCVCAFNQFLIVGGTIENGVECPQRIRWSRLGDITKWKNDANGNGEAGYADLTDGVDWIQAIVPFANYLVVYKERSIQVLSYVGPDLIWDKRPAILGVGLLAPGAIADLGDEHIFIGSDNIYSFDLVQLKTVGDDISRWFYTILNPSKSHVITGFTIEEKSEIWFAFCSVSNSTDTPDMALVYNYDTNAWSIRDMPFGCFGFYEVQADDSWNAAQGTWDSDTVPWDINTSMANAPINLAGGSDGYIYVFGDNSKDGADISCYAQSKLFDLGSPYALKRVMRIQLMVSRQGPFNLQVSIGTADNVDETIKWYGPYNMNLDVTKPPWIDVDITGRYFCVKFGTQKADEPFRLTGYIMYYNLRGNL